MLLREPVTLADAHVRLEPLSLDHEVDLAEAARGLEHAWYTQVPHPHEVEGDIRRRLAWRDEGAMNPWAVRRLATGRVVGVTTFCNIDQPNRHVEIGHTWIGVSAQRTSVNTAAKLLLLAHAFEDCDAIAVEFRTHWHNRQSREAIARLGAKQDGVLRNHRLGPDGTLRDTVVFSSSRTSGPPCRRASAPASPADRAAGLARSGRRSCGSHRPLPAGETAAPATRRTTHIANATRR